ncbi:Crp/Fnr family transcriptional regulator [Luteitalea sp.]
MRCVTPEAREAWLRIWCAVRPQSCVRVRRGAVLMSSTDMHADVIVVESGFAQYAIPGVSGSEIVMSWASDGWPVGTEAFSSASTPVVISAATDCLLHRARLSAVLERARTCEGGLETLNCIRMALLSAATEQFALTVGCSPEYRLAHALSRLSTHRSTRCGEWGGVRDVPCSQVALASLINTSPETVSRILRRWTERRLITRRRGRVVAVSARWEAAYGVPSAPEAPA